MADLLDEKEIEVDVSKDEKEIGADASRGEKETEVDVSKDEKEIVGVVEENRMAAEQLDAEVETQTLAVLEAAERENEVATKLD